MVGNIQCKCVSYDYYWRMKAFVLCLYTRPFIHFGFSNFNDRVLFFFFCLGRADLFKRNVAIDVWVSAGRWFWISLVFLRLWRRFVRPEKFTTSVIKREQTQISAADYLFNDDGYYIITILIYPFSYAVNNNNQHFSSLNLF